MSERDIKGAIAALGEAYRASDELKDRAIIAARVHGGSGESAKKAAEASAENDNVMRQALAELVTGVLVDINRIANALEYLATEKAAGR